MNYCSFNFITKMARTEPFDEHLNEYEQWFTENHWVFQSELEAIRSVIPVKGRGVEIGVGSGIFASPLGIRDGVEPSSTMRRKARERGINAIEGIAEKLPYSAASYDFALMVTTICFVDDIAKSFLEVNRILKNNGAFILGFVDKESPVGKFYLANKERSLFYKDAVFYNTEEVYSYLSGAGFKAVATVQTVFGMLGSLREVQHAKQGKGKGSFIVIKAEKTTSISNYEHMSI